MKTTSEELTEEFLEHMKEHIVSYLEDDPQVFHELSGIESLEDEQLMDEIYEESLDAGNWEFEESVGANKLSFILEGEKTFHAILVLEDCDVIDCRITE